MSGNFSKVHHWIGIIYLTKEAVINVFKEQEIKKGAHLLPSTGSKDKKVKIHLLKIYLKSATVVETHPETQERFHCIFSFILTLTDRKTENQRCRLCCCPFASCPLPVLGCSLSVLLRKRTGQGGQEFIHNQVDLRGEIIRELHGKDHKDTMGEQLQGRK